MWDSHIYYNIKRQSGTYYIRNEAKPYTAVDCFKNKIKNSAELTVRMSGLFEGGFKRWPQSHSVGLYACRGSRRFTNR